MESQSGNLGLEISLIIPLTLRKYTQKSNRPNIYPLFFIQIASDLSLFSLREGFIHRKFEKNLHIINHSRTVFYLISQM